MIMAASERERSQETLSVDASSSFLVEKFPVGTDWLEVDTARHIISAEELGNDVVINSPVLAGVRVGDENTYLILDTRHNDRYQTPYVLVDESVDAFKGIWPGQDLIIGRDYHTDRFDYGSDVSRSHFTISVSEDEPDRLIIKDNNSRNGTRLTGYVLQEKPEDLAATESDARKVSGIRSDYTERWTERLQLSRNFGRESDEAPYGYYMNYPLIGRRSTSVAGGVYGTSRSEQVFIDDKSEAVRATVLGALESLVDMQRDGPASDRAKLVLIQRYVAIMLDYDLDSVEQLSSPHYDKRGIIGLSEYINAGVGVCRHQALLSALVVESAMHHKLLAPGKIRVERNIDEELNGGHAWAVYEGDAGEFIIDAAQNFTGTRKEAAIGGNRWRYIVI